MKVLLITAISLVILASFAIYLEYGNRKFKESLPKHTIKQEETGLETDNQLDDLSTYSESSNEINPVVTGPAFIEEETTDDKSNTLSEIPMVSNKMSNDYWTTHEQNSNPAVEIWNDPATDAVNYRNMSPEEYAEHFKEKLIKKHGDIPEVEMFINLHLILAKNQPMKLDDHVLFVELLNFFYPGEENAQGLEQIKEYRDRFGGDTVLHPGQ